ncbi:MAG: hypothetical protein KC416_16835, partial [Myxococcales bacterium]|nr:hypothetical protein [Myxococcales bacterium]
MKNQPTNVLALRQLATLHESEGDLGGALRVLERLLSVGGEDTILLDARLRAARLADRLGDESGAVTHLLAAVDLDGPAGEAALGLKVRISSPPEWNAYAQALEGYLARQRNAGGPVEAAYLDLSRVLADRLRDLDRAILVLERGITETGDGHTLRAELVRRLRASGRIDDALSELRMLLRETPTMPSGWRELSRTFDEGGHRAAGDAALCPIEVLDAVSEADLLRLQGRVPKPAALAEGTLAPPQLERLFRHGPAERALFEILAILSPILGKMFPADFESYGLTARDRESTKSPTPIRTLATGLARIFATKEFDLFVHRVRSRGVGVELGSSPAIMVPAAVLEFPEPHQVFLLARPIAALALHLEASEKLTPRELEVLVAAAVRISHGNYAQGLTSEDELEGQKKLILKHLP